MIKKLTEEHREACLSFVNKKAAENLFIIGDIEAFGFGEDFQEVWAEFSEENSFRAVMLRYRENFIIYAPGDFNAKGFANLFEQNKQPNKMISGISVIVENVMQYMREQPKKTREMYYAKCESLKDLQPHNLTVKNATVTDVPNIIELHSQIPEFEIREGREESLTECMNEGISRGYYVEEDGKFVSVAMTTAENSMSAMIIGVATLEQYKRKGYASACMKQLCEDLLQEGKSLCLFYDNPEAGTIYKRLGFVDIGKWSMHMY